MTTNTMITDMNEPLRMVNTNAQPVMNSISVSTGKLVTHTKLRNVSDVAVGYGAVWATVDKPSELVRLDPSNGQEIGRPLPIAGTASGLGIGFGSIWVITDKAVIRVQP